MLRTLGPAACVAALLLTPARAQAAVITFSNPSAFVAASTNLSTVTFEGVAPDNGFQYINGPINLAGASFATNTSESDGALFVLGDNFYYTGNSVLSAQASQTGVNSVRIEFPTEITAFGTYFGTLFGTSLNLTLPGGGSATVPQTGALTFFGFTSDVPFSFLTLRQAGGDTLNLDNVSFGQAVSTPEPASLLLLGSGLAGIVARRYKLRR